MDPYVFDSETAMRLYFDGKLEADEVAQLAQWLRQDPENARVFARQAILHRQIRSVLQYQSATLPRRRASRSFSRLRNIAAAVLVCALASYGIYLWQSGTGTLPEAQLLASGLKQIELPNGVSILVEGPARYRIDSPQIIRLEAGKLTAKVPASARGFTVLTPSARVVDLGTEFGVQVKADGSSYTAVFVGSVDLYALKSSAPGSSTRLTRDQAATVPANGEAVTAGIYTPRDFTRELPQANSTQPSASNATTAPTPPNPSENNPAKSGIAKDSDMFKLPAQCEGTELGVSSNVMAAPNGQLVWRIDQVWPDNYMVPANYIPLTWNGAEWGAKDHAQGGAPRIKVENGHAHFSVLGKWNGPNVEHNKLAALSFVAPKTGTYSVSGKANAKPWEGPCKIYNLLLLKKDSERVLKRSEYELPRDGRWVNFSEKINLSAGEHLLFLPIIKEYHNSVTFSVEDLVIRLEP